MDNRASQSGGRGRTNDARQQDRSHSPGTDPYPASDLGNAVGSDRFLAGGGDPASSGNIEEVAVRELREESGYELASGGQLIPLGHYFSSPGFTNERGYLFLARPVHPCEEGSHHDEGESILDCREFTVEEIRLMIAKNDICDANTLSICAALTARGHFVACAALTFRPNGAARHFQIS